MRADIQGARPDLWGAADEVVVVWVVVLQGREQGPEWGRGGGDGDVFEAGI
jgi:hypothetical protein